MIATSLSLAGCRAADDSPDTTATEGVQTRGARQGSANGHGEAADSFLTEARSAVRFRERGHLEFIYRNGQEAEHASILESLGGGVAMFDYDGSGRLDLFFPGGGVFEGEQIIGLPGGMFRNQGDWVFDDVTEGAGIGEEEHYTHGVIVGDFDNDGFPDVLVTGYGGMQLWKNQGDGTFRSVQAEAGIDDNLWSSSAAWGDFNGNGLLDLYVVNYVDWSFDNHPFCRGPGGQREICSPKDFSPQPDTLYLNNGDGTFRDASREVGLRQDGKGLGVVLCDFNENGHLDIYVANDTTDNFLYSNQGQGVFEEVGLFSGTALDDQGVPNGSMGVDVADFNRSGRPDIWVTNYERESFALYRNDGHGNFTHVSRTMGITVLGGLFVGWGTGTTDLTGNGFEDILASNGHVVKFPSASPRKQHALVMLHDGRRYRRLELPEDPYFGQTHEGRGLALGDLDDNGRLDVAISHLNSPVAVLANETPLPEGTRWLRVRLIGRPSNRDAIGSTLRLETSDGPLVRFIRGGGSYLSQHDLRAHWVIPAGVEVHGLTVTWPGGNRQQVAIDQLDRQVTLVEPRDSADSLVGHRVWPKRVGDHPGDDFKSEL